jgi:hypothetical protein
MEKDEPTIRIVSQSWVGSNEGMPTLTSHGAEVEKRVNYISSTGPASNLSGVLHASRRDDRRAIPNQPARSFDRCDLPPRPAFGLLEAFAERGRHFGIKAFEPGNQSAALDRAKE